MSFNGKVIVVTGASSGIGEAIAILAAKNGAEVALTGRNEIRLRKVANQCDAFGKKALIVQADFAKKDGYKVVIPNVIKRFGKIDVLVNNAGTNGAIGKILDGSLRKGYDEIMHVNLTVPVLLTTDAAPHLVKTKGSIVNISSVFFLGYPVYGISKAGLDFFTKSAAWELGASGVRVNSVNPGVVLTDALQSMEVSEDLLGAMMSRLVLPKLVNPDEVAELTLYLASDKAKSITGQNYNIENGFLLKGATSAISLM